MLANLVSIKHLKTQGNRKIGETEFDVVRAFGFVDFGPLSKTEFWQTALQLSVFGFKHEYPRFCN